MAIEYDRVLTVGAFGGSGYDAANGARSASAMPDSLQFGFDLSALSLFKVLSDSQLPRRDLTEAYRRIGDELLRCFPSAARCSTRDSSIRELIRGLQALLSELQAGGYLASFSIDDTDADETLWQMRSSLSVTRLTVTLTDSATLRAALLLNGSGVSPELVRPLISGYLSACGAQVSESTEFFLDSYRESPFDYRPSQTLLSFTIAPDPST